MNDKQISRRDFLIAAGCGCAGLALAGTGCTKLAGTTATAALICPYGYRYDPWPGQCYRYVDSNGSGYCDLSESATITTTATSASGLDSATQSSTVEGNTTTTVLCDRHCRYPGQCGRFVDSDGSGYCDLSEGVTVSAATATSTTGSADSPAVTASATARPAGQSTPAAANSSTTSAELVILCDRGCRYPGHCGRYSDSDGTGVCDLSEGIPAEQAANYAGAGSRGRGGRGG
jgi:hypothetical protein